MQATPPEAPNPKERVDAANGASRVQPTRAGYLNAVQVYPYADGALYQLYAAPGEVSDIALEPGEQLAGSGPVAAGDTVRWIIGDTESGFGATKRVPRLTPMRLDFWHRAGRGGYVRDSEANASASAHQNDLRPSSVLGRLSSNRM